MNVAVAVTRRLGPSDERFGAELLELRKRVLEQAMSVLELPAAGMT